MRILFLSRWFPAPADNGSKVRVLHLLRALSSRHTVTLVAFTPDTPDQENVRTLLQVCAAVHPIPLRMPGLRGVDGVLGFFDRRPRSVRADFSPEMQARVRAIWDTDAPDVVIASQIDMAPYALGIEGATRILDEVELIGLWEQVASAKGFLQRVRRRLMWIKRAAYTRRVLEGFAATTVVSEAEKVLLESALPGRAAPEVIPNGADVDLESSVNVHPVPGTIIYAGSVTYAPNLEAVQFFVDRVLPSVRAAVPGATFTVTGRTEGVSLDGLQGVGGVSFPGLLSDVRPAVANSWLSVAPILSGGGTRLKVLESLSLGTPVVSTSKGAEGLKLEAGRHVLIADDAPTFAEHVIRVLEDPALRRRLGDEGRREVARQYDWNRIGAAFCALVERAAREVA